MNFAIKPMNFAIKSMNFVVNMMDCVLKMMNFEFQMMISTQNDDDLSIAGMYININLMFFTRPRPCASVLTASWRSFLKMMNFRLKTMDCIENDVNFVLKMMNFVLKIVWILLKEVKNFGKKNEKVLTVLGEYFEYLWILCI